MLDGHRDLVVDILRSYQLAMAESGEEALAVAAQFQPDVILLDIMMPGIDGYDTCRKLREDERYRDTKIMFVSAKELMSGQLQAFDSGGDDYLAKPFANDELLARVALLSRLSSDEKAV